MYFQKMYVQHIPFVKIIVNGTPTEGTVMEVMCEYVSLKKNVNLARLKRRAY